MDIPLVAAEFLNSLDDDVAIWPIGCGGGKSGVFQVGIDLYVRDEARERYCTYGKKEVMGRGAHSEGVMEFVEQLLRRMKRSGVL
ncbi:hypothetical protein HDV00_005201 [Rhizophlyctis rosea]|nr:hypothetical protein HDV00_005201 [Rhizophlyctis rosea]